MFQVRFAAVAVALTLLLVGCSDDDPKPAPEPSLSMSTSTSTAPTSTPTPRPSQLLDPEQTVRAWVRARNKTVQTGSRRDVDALSAPSCETCRNSVDPVAKVYDKGGRYETSGWTVVRSRIVEQSAEAAEVSAALRYEAGKTYPSAGSPAVSYDVERHIAVFRLLKADTGWLIEFIGYLS